MTPARLLLLAVAAAPVADAGIEGSPAVLMDNYPLPSGLPENAEDFDGTRKLMGWTRERMRRWFRPAQEWDQSMMIESGEAEVEEPIEVRVLNEPGGITLLNRFTFDDNVIKDKEGDLLVEHWVVEFCVHWWEPCQKFGTHFNDVGQRLTEELNADRVVTKRVNFARVNCATDKVLCNEQGVEDSPTVRHYYHGQPVSTWRRREPKRDHERLLSWVTFELKERLWGEEKEREERRKSESVEFTFELRELAATLVATLGCCWAFWGVAFGTGVPRTAQLTESRPSAHESPEPVEVALATTSRLIPDAWVEERKEVEL